MSEWIRKPKPILTDSFHDTVNFLYREENIFIMDNHLAAGWAWLNLIDPTVQHNLLHIDRHYDLLDFPTTVQQEVIDKGISLKDLSFEEYLNLRQTGSNGDSWPMFRWDNYILNIQLAYPNIYGEKIFATQYDGNKPDGFIDQEAEFLELVSNIDYWVETRNKNGWIINLDLDYFFNHVNERRIQVFTNELVTELARNIKKVISKIEVLTICLSPECCGGWDNSFAKLKIFCDILGLDFFTHFERITTHNKH